MKVGFRCYESTEQTALELAGFGICQYHEGVFQAGLGKYDDTVQWELIGVLRKR